MLMKAFLARLRRNQRMDSGEAALSRVESQESRAFRWRFALADHAPSTFDRRPWSMRATSSRSVVSRSKAAGER